MKKNMKIKIHNGLKESGIGFLFAVAYIIFKYYYWPDFFIWLAEIIFIFFCVAFCFIRGYQRGNSIANFKQELQEKKEEMYAGFSEDLKCYKCSSIIKPEDNSCPVCGWTWEL